MYPRSKRIVFKTLFLKSVRDNRITVASVAVERWVTVAYIGDTVLWVQLR